VGLPARSEGARAASATTMSAEEVLLNNNNDFREYKNRIRIMKAANAINLHNSY
jgi:hypothetical protein